MTEPDDFDEVEDTSFCDETQPAFGQQDVGARLYSDLGVSTEAAISFQQHYAARRLLELGDPESEVVRVILAGERLVEDMVVELAGGRRQHIQVKQVLAEDRNWTIHNLGQTGDEGPNFWRRAYAIYRNEPSSTIVLATDGSCGGDLLWVKRTFPRKAGDVERGKAQWDSSEQARLQQLADSCGCDVSVLPQFLEHLEIGTKLGSHDELERANLAYARGVLGLPPDGYFAIFAWVCGESRNRPTVDRDQFGRLLDDMFGLPRTVDETPHQQGGYVPRQVLENQILDAVADINVAIVLVEGQVGAGKTRLLAHLAETQGWPAHFLHLGVSRDPLRFCLAEALVGLASRMRDLGWDAAPIRKGATDRDIRAAFEAALARRSTSGVGEQDVVLVDGVDETTAVGGEQEVLSYFTNLRVPTGVKVVVGARPGIWRGDRPDLRVIPAGPLELGETAQMVRGSLPGVTWHQIQGLHQRSEGTPLYLRLFLDALGTPPDFDQALAKAASGLVDYIRQTLRQAATDPMGLGLLRVLSLTRCRLDVSLLAQVLEVSPLELDSRVTGNVRALLIPDELALAHSALREYLENDLPDQERQRLHSRLADVLDGLPFDRLERAEIAEHLVEAGRTDDLFARLETGLLLKRLEGDNWHAVHADILQAITSYQTLDDLWRVLPACVLLECMRASTDERCDHDVLERIASHLGWETVPKTLLRSVPTRAKLVALERLLGRDDLPGPVSEALSSLSTATASTLTRVATSALVYPCLLTHPEDEPGLTTAGVVDRLISLEDLDELDRLLDDFSSRRGLLSHEDVRQVLDNLEARALAADEAVLVASARIRFTPLGPDDLCTLADRVVNLASPSNGVWAGEALLRAAARLHDLGESERGYRCFEQAITAFASAEQVDWAIMRQLAYMRAYQWREEWVNAWIDGLVAVTKQMAPSWSRLDAMEGLAGAELERDRPVSFSRDDVLDTLRAMTAPVAGARPRVGTIALSVVPRWTEGRSILIQPGDREVFVEAERHFASTDLSRLRGWLRRWEAGEVDRMLEVVAKHYRRQGWLEDEERVIQTFHVPLLRGHYRMERLKEDFEGLTVDETLERYRQLISSDFEGFAGFQRQSLEQAVFSKVLSLDEPPAGLEDLPQVIADSGSFDADVLTLLAKRWGAHPAEWGGAEVKTALLGRAAVDSRRSRRCAILAGMSASLDSGEAQEATYVLLTSLDHVYVSGLDRADCQIGAALALQAPELAARKEEWLGTALIDLHPLAVLAYTLPVSDPDAIQNVIGRIESPQHKVDAMIGLARRLFGDDPGQAAAILGDAVSLAADMPAPKEGPTLDGATRDDVYVALLDAALLKDCPAPMDLLAEITEPAQRAVAHSMLAAHNAGCGEMDAASRQLVLLESEWDRLGEGEATSWLVYVCARKNIGLPGDVAIPASLKWLNWARDGVSAAADPDKFRSWCLDLAGWQVSPAELAGVVRAVVGWLQENRACDLPHLLECLADARQQVPGWPREADQDIARLLLSIAPDKGLRWLPYLKPGDERVYALCSVAGPCDDATWQELRQSVLAQRDYLFEDSRWFEALLAVARAGIDGSTAAALDLLRAALMTAYARPKHRMVDMCWIVGSIVWRFADHLSPDAAAVLASDHHRLTEPFR
jgi:hypothetical protein